MKYIVSMITSLLFCSGLLQAQTLNDAIRYSDINLGGTARSIGVGNSLGALGADFTVLSTNPAGLAQFRSSSFTVTPSLSINSADAMLQGNGNLPFNESKTNFNFSNLGLVLAKRPSSSRWKTSNLGIGFNRIANFHRKTFFRGTSQGSIVDRWVFEANQADGFLNDFETGPASDAFAIYTDGINPEITSDFELKPDAIVQREQEFRSSGSMNELVFGYAGNYREKLMIGFSIGIPFVSYDEERVYREVDIDSIPFFNELAYEENLSTTGVGVNLKLGMIYRVNQMVRLGFAVHTPTGFNLTDNFTTAVTYDYTDAENDGPVTGSSPQGNFEYRFRSPWRLIGSAAVLIKKQGFISAELEWVDYSANSFNLTANSSAQEDRAFEEALNGRIASNLSSTMNLRLGGEYVLDKMRLRAGYNLSGDPAEGLEEARNSFSLGFGLQEESFSLDFAYRHIGRQETIVPYVLDGEPSQVADLDFSPNQFFLTFGFRF